MKYIYATIALFFLAMGVWGIFITGLGDKPFLLFIAGALFSIAAEISDIGGYIKGMK